MKKKLIILAAISLFIPVVSFAGKDKPEENKIYYINTLCPNPKCNKLTRVRWQKNTEYAMNCMYCNRLMMIRCVTKVDGTKKAIAEGL